MKKMSANKTYHQFCFSSDQNEVMHCKQYSDSSGEDIQIIKDSQWNPSPFVLPAVNVPKGLSDSGTRSGHSARKTR